MISCGDCALGRVSLEASASLRAAGGTWAFKRSICFGAALRTATADDGERQTSDIRTSGGTHLEAAEMVGEHGAEIVECAASVHGKKILSA